MIYIHHSIFKQLQILLIVINDIDSHDCIPAHCFLNHLMSIYIYPITPIDVEILPTL